MAHRGTYCLDFGGVPETFVDYGSLYRLMRYFVGLLGEISASMQCLHCLVYSFCQS